jgi:hypothetical protein
VPDITDLRTPTPYTFTYTGTGVTECEAAPLTDFVTYTAIVDGTTFTASDPATLLFSSAPVVYGSAVFPDLIVTNLQQAQIITMVIQTLIQV